MTNDCTVLVKPIVRHIFTHYLATFRFPEFCSWQGNGLRSIQTFSRMTFDVTPTRIICRPDTQEETCRHWNDSPSQQVDLAFNLFFMVFFIIRVSACLTWPPHLSLPPGCFASFSSLLPTTNSFAGWRSTPSWTTLPFLLSLWAFTSTDNGWVSASKQILLMRNHLNVPLSCRSSFPQSSASDVISRHPAVPEFVAHEQWNSSCPGVLHLPEHLVGSSWLRPPGQLLSFLPLISPNPSLFFFCCRWRSLGIPSTTLKMLKT